jgi:ABC-type Fe3+ transport system permease subunit
MGQPQQPGKTKEEEKEEEEAKRLAEQEKLEEEREREEEQRRALEHMQMQLQAAQQAAQRAKSEAAQRAQEAALARPDDMSDICIASIIIYCIGFILGICSVVRTNDAYDAHLDYEEESTYSSNIRQRSGSLYETWQMARNTALGTGASAVVCFSLAFLLVFWSGMQYKMKRKVVPGFCMTGLFISGWIVFALTFLIDVVVLVLAFDEDNVVYPEVVWAAFIGNVAAWLLMMTHSELARRR